METCRVNSGSAARAPVGDGREPGVGEEPVGRAIADRDETIRIGIRKRTQQDGVHDGEDRGVRADAERQREDGRGGEAGCAPQHAQAVADVLAERVEPRQAALIAPGLRGLRIPAEGQPRRMPRRRGIESLFAYRSSSISR